MALSLRHQHLEAMRALLLYAAIALDDLTLHEKGRPLRSALNNRSLGRRSLNHDAALDGAT